MSDLNEPVVPKEGTPAPESTLPDALKGRTPEDIYNILRAEHIQEMSEETQRHASAVETIANRPLPSAPFSPPPAPPQPAAHPEFDISNPEAYLEDQFNQRMRPVVSAIAEAGRSTGRALLTSKLPPEEWKRFGPEIEQLINSMAPQAQAQPAAYEHAYNVVRSMHLEEIIPERVATEAKKMAAQILTEMGLDASKLTGQPTATPSGRSSIFQGRVGVVTSNPRSTSATLGGVGSQKLSEVEKLMCDKFNMTEDEYILYKAMNTDVISTGALK